MLSSEEALKKIKQKAHLYQGVVNLGWYLPEESARICTRDFINGVRIN